MENPYALGGAQPHPPVERRPAREYTAEDVVELTEGYDEMRDADLWRGIPNGTHLRFRKKDGKFLVGGFLHNYYRDAATGKEAFYIENSTNRRDSNYFKFKLDFDNLDVVWKKRDHTLVSVAEFTGVMREVLEQVKKIEKRITKLEKNAAQMEGRVQRLARMLDLLTQKLAG